MFRAREWAGRRSLAVGRAWRAGLLLCCGAWSWGAPLGARADAGAAVPIAVFRTQITEARGAASACAGNADACAAAVLPSDETLSGADRPITVSWGWLREAFGAARRAQQRERADSMQAAEAHLDELAAEVDAPQAVTAPEFGRARREADAALARDEFRVTQAEPTWLDRQYARLQDLLLKALFGLTRLGQGAPWLAPFIEWSCFLLAAAGLLYFLRQSLQRQALRIALGGGAMGAARTAHDATDWHAQALLFAAAAAWREAVHALYWAGISLLESRRAWRPNAARTPREYVRLLPPGSPAQRALATLTRSLEGVWYGHAAGDEAAYRAALASFEALETANPSGRTAGAPIDAAALAGRA